MVSLRRLASPFLLLCHPDKFSSIPMAQKVNLEAVQTLNELIDSCQSTATSSTRPSTVQSRYRIEFMVPAASSTVNNNKRGKSNANSMCTRREVTLHFGQQLSQSSSSHTIIRKARREIRKLLLTAGLEPPPDEYDKENEEEDQDAENSSLWEDLGLDSDEQDANGRGIGRRKSRSRWEASQRRFARSIDSEERKARHDRAVRRMEADLATRNLMTEVQKRQIIADVISRVRFDSQDQDEVSLMEQLIALRRLSLLFMEHFSKENIEHHGRIWERLVIVLCQDDTHSLEQRQKRRKKGGGETGFKFSVRNNDSADIMEDCVTAMAPIDFLDEELVLEFQKSLDDLYVYDEEDFNFV